MWDPFGYRRLDESIDAIIDIMAELSGYVVSHFLRLENQMGLLQDKIEALKVEVTELTTVVNSAVTLIVGLADLIRESKNAPAQLEELATNLDAQAAALAAAVAANVIVPDPPVEPPVE